MAHSSLTTKAVTHQSPDYSYAQQMHREVNNTFEGKENVSRLSREHIDKEDTIRTKGECENYSTTCCG